MIVIADSGSTKADWRFLMGKDVRSIDSMGFNPVFHSSELIEDKLREAIAADIPTDDTTEVHFYGAGCSDHPRKQVITQALSSVFPQAEMNINPDLLGAARATCGQEAGIACIMGTGSNTCLYDGHTVIDNVTTLGYLLGDEGSGTHLGKKLVRHYFYREMPEDLAPAFRTFLGGGKEKILNEVYGTPTPNVYLASLTRFMSAHKDHPFIQRILYRSFAEFIDRHVRKYEGYLHLPIHFIGSIAYIFRDVLRLVLTARAMHPGIFIKQPIDRLVDFHNGQLK